MEQIVLLGDSIFDNKSYVGNGKDVITHLREFLDPNQRKATLLAVDGNRVKNISTQLKRLPNDASHLFISVGGNDALDNMSILSEDVVNSAQTFDKLATIAEDFEQSYDKMLNQVLDKGLPITLCTIYYPRFEEPWLQRLAVSALATFNDVIIRKAFEYGCGLIDLRLVCDDDADYANPIEPSDIGGRKIADTIKNHLDGFSEIVRVSI